MLIVLGCIILSGTIVAYVKNDSGAPSPYNNIAFLVIFIFTLKQYRRLKTHFSTINSVEMNILNVLIVLETFCIVLDGFFILCFFQGVTSFLQCLRLAMTLIQLLKIYIVLSLFASLTILWHSKEEKENSFILSPIQQNKKSLFFQSAGSMLTTRVMVICSSAPRGFRRAWTPFRGDVNRAMVGGAGILAWLRS